MKSVKLFLLSVGFALTSFLATAQDTVVAPLQYDMTFKGRGEATTVQSVFVENLSSGELITLNGSNVLRLTNTPSGIEDVEAEMPRVQSVVYPNPSYGQAQLTFANRAAGDVSITIYDMQGKMMTNGSFSLTTGKHTASLPAMPVGAYAIALRGQGINESVRWMSMGGGMGGNLAIATAGAENFQPLQTDGQPAKIAQPEPHFRAAPENANADIVEMIYADGELLRFTGTSGTMTTIVMNIPTLSHDITFDFYNCTDAGGYHYTIVNAGGVLWMAEDLRNVPQSVVPIRTSQQQWASYPAEQPKQAYYQFSNGNASKGGYYNHAGAKAALPAGWNLPTADEVNYMINKLGGYERAANKLKARGDAWAQQQNTPDTVSFGAAASGLLTPDGAFEGEEFKVQYWTRSTKNSVPIFWGIENSDMLLDPDVTASVGHGLRVRGCRPAPSAYEGVAALFRNENENTPRAQKALFEDGPLGGAYVVSSEKKKFFTEYSYRPNDGTTNTASNNFYKYDFTNGKYTPTKMPHNNG
ncbi:MAG: T9SS type A sorting domain-containing protein, partial [Cytophagaceae bacterium]|nr:T9SS type A sorting domain-containing protein [Cytophagaceae bacterium]